MSSSGIISNIHTSPTNNYTENARKVDLSTLSSTSQNSNNQKITGIVNEVHPKNPRFIKAYSSNGAMISDGKWIELTHLAQEIAERWGTVRVGFEVKVNISGPNGVGSDAYIIGSETQSIDSAHIPNEAEQGLYYIFCPGSFPT
jgi:hypothetical protein